MKFNLIASCQGRKPALSHQSFLTLTHLRTKSRPLVTGEISNKAAQLLRAGCLTSGLAFLGGLVNPATALLGLGNYVLYTYIYTDLKRVTPLNTPIGAVVGALPPGLFCSLVLHARAQFTAPLAPVMGAFAAVGCTDALTTCLYVSCCSTDAHG